MREALLATPDAGGRLLEAWRSGRSLVLIDPRLPEPEQARRRTFADRADDEPSVVVFTSGTTSEARAVVLPWSSLQACAEAVVQATGLVAGDRWLCPLPLSHVGGLGVLLRCALVGAEARMARFTPAELAAELAAGATHVSLVARMVSRLLDEAPEFAAPRLRLAMVGGGPSEPALIARARAAGLPAVTTYGLTEACSTVTLGRLGAPTTAPGDAGWALPGRELRIEPDGRIAVRGAGLMSGYDGAPRGGDWLVSGDHGHLLPDGRLVVEDRRTDRIVTGGENVAPSEVERVIAGLPGVLEVCVVGLPDPSWGQRVVAAIVWRGEPDPASVHDAVAALAPWQRPKELVSWVGPLPRAALGKLLRREVRRALVDA